MFHHAHSYVASKLYKSEDPLILVGSIIPDLAITRIFSWQHGGLHGLQEREKFKEFVGKNYPNFISFSNGVIGHNIVDDFTHLEYHTKPGYAFQNNTELVGLVGNLYQLKGQQAASKAHNFIESAVDILLLKDNLSVQENLKNAISSVDREVISDILSNHFAISKKQMLGALDTFFALFTKYDFSVINNWISFWRELEEFMKLKDIGDDSRRLLLDKSIEVVNPTYQDFLSYSIEEGKIS